MEQKGDSKFHFGLKVKSASRCHLESNMSILHILVILNKKFFVENYKYRN